MSASLSVILSALLPVFGLIALGILLRRWRVLGGDDSVGLDRFVYYVALPAQLVTSIAQTDIRAHFDGAVLIAAVTAYGLGLSGAWLCTGHLSAAQRGSVLNGAARANGAFVGLPLVHLLAQGVPDGQGQALETAYLVLLAAMVPCFNVGAVIGFTLPQHGLSLAGLLRSLAELPRNPIIIGSGMGVVCSLFFPGILQRTLPGTMISMVGLCAIPLALIVTGSHLDMATVRARPVLLALTAFAKLFMLPALTWCACSVLSVDDDSRKAAVLMMACPTAMAAVSMARVLSADHELMAALIAASTILAPVTLFGWMCVLL